MSDNKKSDREAEQQRRLSSRGGELGEPIGNPHKHHEAGNSAATFLTAFL